jgi:UDP-2,3-diacylglucosamine hydrolase
MAALFVSDLHLDPARPDITALFLQFLRGDAREAEALYILGDLFEAWVGDDADDALAESVREGLRELVAAGVPVWLMRGNRDFLLGERFARDTGARLLADPCVVRVGDQPVLLMHGDQLCTDDAAYQAFRAQVRAPEWAEGFLAQPLAARREFAAKARAASGEHQASLQAAGQLDAITDVNADAVAATMRRFGVQRLVHGHTHRPAIHALDLAGRRAQRIVLGDWYEQGSVLRMDADGAVLSSLSAQGLA